MGSIDGDEWQTSPVLTGLTRFEPRPDVRNILITGGAGFIASWLARHLTIRYRGHYHVACFDSLEYSSSTNNFRVLEKFDNFAFIRGDVTSFTDVTHVLQKYRIDTIFHFAAQSHVDHSFDHAFDFTQANVIGTQNMLECAVNSRTISRFIHVSTDEVLGEVGMDEPDLVEDSMLAPTNPYSASKAAAEMYVLAYQKSFKLPIVTARLNNLYGPYQFPEKVIPRFTTQLLEGLPLTLHGDGSTVRRYLYAGDATDAFDTILHRGAMGEIYNIASSDEISTLNLAHKFLQIFRVPPQDRHKWIQITQDRPFNDKRYATSADKLRALGWRQQTSFNDGLSITIDWYRRFGHLWWGRQRSESDETRPSPVQSPRTHL